MTAHKFYEKLAETTTKLRWYKDVWGKEIRGKFPKGRRCFCPITAVYFMQTGKYVAPCDVSDAIHALKLNENFSHKVIVSADCIENKHFVKTNRRLRQILGIK